MTAKMCCLCRARHNLRKTELPGSGYRCTDQVNCKRRQRQQIDAHLDFAAIDDEVR